jgi:hypothetical protein
MFFHTQRRKMDEISVPPESVQGIIAAAANSGHSETAILRQQATREILC